MINYSIEYALNHIFDGVMVSPDNALAVAAVSNLAFIKNTYKLETTSYDNAIATIDNMLAKHKELENTAEYHTSYNNEKRNTTSIGNGQIFTKEPNMTAFISKLVRLKADLVKANKIHKKNKAEKFADTVAVSNYNTDAPILVDNEGNITGIQFDRLGVDDITGLKGKSIDEIIKIVEDTFNIAKAQDKPITDKDKKTIKTKLLNALDKAKFTKQAKGVKSASIIKEVGTQKIVARKAYLNAIANEINNDKELDVNQKKEILNELLGLNMRVRPAKKTQSWTNSEQAVENFLERYRKQAEAKETIRRAREVEAKKAVFQTADKEGSNTTYSQSEINTITRHKSSQDSMDNGIVSKAIAAVKDLINTGKSYVVLDLESTFNDQDLSYENRIFDFSVAKFKGKEQVKGTDESIYHAPEDLAAYKERIKGSKYEQGITSEVEAATEDEGKFAEQLYNKLFDVTERGTLPIVAFNGITADFLWIQQLAARVGGSTGIKLEDLLQNIEVIDPYLATKPVSTNVDDKTRGQRKLEVLAKHYGITERPGHIGMSDVLTLHDVMKKLANDKAVTSFLDNNPTDIIEETKTSNKDENDSTVVDDTQSAEDLNNLFGSSKQSIAFDAHKEELERIKGDTVESIFDRFMQLDMDNKEEKPFLQHIFDNLVKPFYEGGTETLLAAMYDARNKSGKSLGIVELKGEGMHDLIGVTHRQANLSGKSDQSSASVLMHEIGHIMIDKIFSEEYLDNRFNVYKQHLETIYDDVVTASDKSWLDENDQMEYNYIFNNENKTRGMKEFYARMFSDVTLSQKVADNISNPTVSKGVKINTKDGVIAFIESIFMKILDYIIEFGSTDKNLDAHQLLLSMAVEMNGLENMYKSRAFNAVRATLDKVEAYNAYLKYIDAGDLLNNRLLDTAAMVSAIDIKPEVLHRWLIKDYTGDVGGLLQDILPSTEFMNPYVNHATRSATTISKSRQDMIERVSKFIQGTNKKTGKSAIEVGEDTLLYDLALAYDMRALYVAAEGTSQVKADTVIYNLQNSDATEAYAQMLERKIKASPELIEDMVAAGLELHNRAINKVDKNAARPENNNAKNLAERYTRHHEDVLAMYEEEKIIDAIITSRAMLLIDKNTLKTFNKLLKDKEAFRNSFQQTMSIANDVEVDRRVTVSSHSADNFIKGDTVKVTDDNTRLVPVVMTPSAIEAMELAGHEVVDTVELKSAGIKIGIYKVENSPTQSRAGGSIGMIDLETAGNKNLAQLLVEAGAKPEVVKRILKKINYQESTQIANYFTPTVDELGTQVVDYLITIPEHLVQEHLTIDNRASVSLAHAKGKIDEFTNSKIENDKWLDIAAKDVRKNLVQHPEDFVWIGMSSS